MLWEVKPEGTKTYWMYCIIYGLYLFYSQCHYFDPCNTNLAPQYEDVKRNVSKSERVQAFRTQS